MILESMRKLGLETWLHLVGAFLLSRKSESELCFFVILNMQESESEFVAFTIELIVDIAESESTCLLSGPS